MSVDTNTSFIMELGDSLCRRLKSRLSLTGFPPIQQTHSDIMTGNVSVNQVLRVSLRTD